MSLPVGQLLRNKPVGQIVGTILNLDRRCQVDLHLEVGRTYTPTHNVWGCPISFLTISYCSMVLPFCNNWFKLCLAAVSTHLSYFCSLGLHTLVLCRLFLSQLSCEWEGWIINHFHAWGWSPSQRIGQEHWGSECLYNRQAYGCHVRGRSWISGSNPFWAGGPKNKQTKYNNIYLHICIYTNNTCICSPCKKWNITEKEIMNVLFY